MSTERKHIISVRQLSAGYKQHKVYNRVLQDISFDVLAGDLICLMGPNGAGKSTLLRCISGLQKFESGEILIDGRSTKNISTDQLSKQLAVVLTEQMAASHMTVRELIAMGRYPHLGWLLKYTEDDNRIINQTAFDCGITHLLNKNIHALSDGQRQKVLIARALAQESRLLILDEPTSHLDLNNRVEILRLLKEISRKDGKAIIMATHELDLALQMADRLLLLSSDGNLSQGIPEDLVLNGKIDEVFAFKGFDLKTGKVAHPQSGKHLKLKGEGHVYLWTRNALEREGYVLNDKSTEEVAAYELDGTYQWIMNSQTFSDIQSLLQYLKEKGH